jgi:hypothetical protein
MRRPLALLFASSLALPLAFLGCSGGGETTSGTSTTTSTSGTAGAGTGGEAGLPPTYTDPKAVQGRLKGTLDDLAAFGSKRCGTEAGMKAGDYVKQRFEKGGLTDVSFESFSFLSWELASSSLAVDVEGSAVPMEHDVFQYSGKGHVDADIVDVGTGHDNDYVGKDVTGKVALVTRDPIFHRQAQYLGAAVHGAAAMLYVSQAPKNLIQIGTVADPEDGLATIPTITVGADDGQKIKDALGAGKVAHAVIDVDAAISPGTGRNVVARFPGSDPSGGYVVVGAHYDTWYVGSTDNGGGTAALLEIAEALAHGPQHKYGVVFVGYDGEELGLFGGYDYLRRHVIVENEPMLAFINLEMPGAGPAGTGSRAMAATSNGPMSAAASISEAKKSYPLFVGMEGIPDQFGGLIPTDIQGMYWSGLQGVTTYCNTDYYHTVEDTPDKIDLPFLAEASMAIERMTSTFDTFPAATFQKRDSNVWFPTVSTKPAANGDLTVDVTVLDINGSPQAAAKVTLWVDVDDFTRAFRVEGAADGAGKVTLTIPKAALDAGKGGRYLHITAGKTYPLAEHISPLP